MSNKIQYFFNMVAAFSCHVKKSKTTNYCTNNITRVTPLSKSPFRNYQKKLQCTICSHPCANTIKNKSKPPQPQELQTRRQKARTGAYRSKKLARLCTTRTQAKWPVSASGGDSPLPLREGEPWEGEIDRAREGRYSGVRMEDWTELEGL